MKNFRWLALAIVIVMLSGCATGNGGLPFFPTSTPLPTAVAFVTHAPDAAPVMPRRWRQPGPHQ